MAENKEIIKKNESEKPRITNKNDFIELRFTARNLTNNQVFDTNILEEAKKLNSEIKETKPLIICIGNQMVVPGLDEALAGKEINKKYSVKLGPEKAFGKRNPHLTKLIPIKYFLEQKIYPEAGMTLALDNNLVKVMSVSGGRVLVDFNNPLAGKDLKYEFFIPKLIEENSEKINSLQDYFFGQRFDYDLDEQKKKIIFKDLKLMSLLNAFKDKFKDMLGFEIEILEKKPEKSEKKQENKERNQEETSTEEQKKEIKA